MKQNLYTSDTTLSCGIPWTIPRVSCIFSVYDECVYQENTSDKWNIPWYTTRERYITILYYAIEIQWLTESMLHICDAWCAIHVAHDGDWRLGVIPSNVNGFLVFWLAVCLSYGINISLFWQFLTYYRQYDNDEVKHIPVLLKISPSQSDNS